MLLLIKYLDHCTVTGDSSGNDLLELVLEGFTEDVLKF